MDNQLLWFHKVIKSNKRITRNDIKNICERACSSSLEDEKIDDIIKGLNSVVKVLRYNQCSFYLKLVQKIAKKRTNMDDEPPNRFADIPEPIINMIAKHSTIYATKKLEKLITGMTTTTVFLRKNERISLYKASKQHKYQPDLQKFFEGYLLFRLKAYPKTK